MRKKIGVGGGQKSGKRMMSKVRFGTDEGELLYRYA